MAEERQVAGTSSEPVLVALTAPARRSLIDGLVRPIGATPSARLVDVDVPDSTLADFLAGIAHSDTGFVARTTSGPRALAIIAATAATLCGEDIRTALANPDIAFLTALRPPAIEAVRSVLLAIETETPDAVARALEVLERPPLTS